RRVCLPLEPTAAHPSCLRHACRVDNAPDPRFLPRLCRPAPLTDRRARTSEGWGTPAPHIAQPKASVLARNRPAKLLASPPPQNPPRPTNSPDPPPPKTQASKNPTPVGPAEPILAGPLNTTSSVAGTNGISLTRQL